MKYWVFKHGNDDYAEDIIDKALENNFCMCQYEYEFQDNGTVTRIWNLLKEIKEGDLIILGAYGNKYKYAWGYAIKPRFEKNLEKVQLNCEEVINTRHNNFQYRSDNYNGYIEFNDCECFYENLEDGESGWGQRIDIDQWRNIERDSIEYIHEYRSLLLGLGMILTFVLRRYQVIRVNMISNVLLSQGIKSGLSLLLFIVIGCTFVSLLLKSLILQKENIYLWRQRMD